MSLAWTIEITEAAQRQFRKLDRQVIDRITRALRDLATLENPRERGKALTGEFAGLWRYRVGDYRVIAKIEQGRMLILILTVGHRSAIYRN